MKFKLHSLVLAGYVFGFTQASFAKDAAKDIKDMTQDYKEFYPSECSKMTFLDQGTSEESGKRIRSFEVVVKCHLSESHKKTLGGLVEKYKDLLNGKLEDKTRQRVGEPSDLKNHLPGFSGIHFPVKETLTGGTFVVKTDTSLQVKKDETALIYDAPLIEMIKTDFNTKYTHFFKKRVDVTQKDNGYELTMTLNLQINPPWIAPDSILVPQTEKSALKSFALDVHMHMDLIRDYAN